MMSQFGKNPPWARDVGPISQAAGIALNQSQIGLVSQMYGQSAVAAPTVFSIQPGIALPTSLASSHVATVSYPAPRPAASAIQQKQRVFTGAVTKLHENFGFVDEDVFFQTSCVKGQQPKLGDRVLVEATYNANMPFKWNATRIQVLPTNVQAINSPQTSQAYQAMVAQSSFHTVTPASQANTAFHFKSGAIGSSTIPNLAQPPPPLMSKQTQPVQGRCLNLGQGSRRSESSGFRDRSDRLRERAASRERRERRSPRKRSRSPRRGSRSPRKSRSPRSPSSRTKSPVRQRRAARPVSRYTVQIPKISLDLKEANLMMLRSRYSNMYIPSDFFSSAFLWVEVFPAHRPFVLGHSCDFHVMQKTIEPLIKPEPVAEPSDADYRFSAKVMLLSCPTLDDIFHKSCALAEDPSEVRESFQHPTRLIQFLVGLKGKSEPMAIGGPWSPSLDGPNPEGDQRCLINTAIRTTKVLTGIDLSHCTQWFRFTEIRYYRPEEVRKGRTVPAHVETVVIFLPDVWTCRPTSLEWQTLSAEYKTQLDSKLSTEEFKTKEEEVEVEKEVAEDKKDPTHHSELDPKTMKLNDLRQELECRGLSSKGLKSQLIARLTKALRSEEEKEAEETENRCAEEEENREDDEGGKMDVDEKEEDSKKLEEEEKLRAKEKERANLIRQYTLPDTPSILVRPSTTAKGGKFECSVMSLSLLLDYRPEDNKEHVFEVSLFAEMFNEMLMRDFGFRIYKLLVSSPETAEDEKKDKPKDEDKKDKAKSKDDEKKDSSKTRDVDEVKREGSDVEKCDSKRSLQKTQASSKKDEQRETEKMDDNESTQEKKKDVKHEDPDDESGETVTESVDPDQKPDIEAVKMETEEPVSMTPEPKTSPGKSLKHSDVSAESKLTIADTKPEEDQSRVHGDDDHDDGKDEKDKKSTRSLAKHDRARFFTAEPDLLLAFIYFDQSHAGYLVDKDVEEILYTLGLQLSRAQVKKLVSKLASRDMLNYRKLTDVVAEKDEDNKGISAIVTSDAVDQPDDRALALGNRRFLHAVETDADLPHGILRKRTRLEAEGDEEAGSTSAVVSSDGVVMHNGVFVDINSIMQNLNKSEKSRVSMEARLKELQQDLENVRTSYGLTESANQTMSTEIQQLKKKLRDQRRSLDQIESNAKKYRDLLTRTRSTLSTLTADIKDAVTVCDKDVKTKPEVTE